MENTIQNIDQKLGLFAAMIRIRLFENKVAHARDQALVPGLPHLSHGGEAIAVGVCSQLDPNIDRITGSHRSHAAALAVGVPMEPLFAELMGRGGGLSSGMGGTQHIIDPDHGFLCSNGIVGAQVPLAAGAALSAKTLATGGIAVTFFGDGAINQGAVMETMNLATVMGLPLLFIVENNGVAQATASDDVSAGPGITARARALAMPAELIKGIDVNRVVEGAERMIKWVREHKQPALIEFECQRLGGHFHGDGRAETASDMDDPYTHMREYLLKMGAEDNQLRVIEAGEGADVENAFVRALASPEASEQQLQSVALKADL